MSSWFSRESSARVDVEGGDTVGMTAAATASAEPGDPADPTSAWSLRGIFGQAGGGDEPEEFDPCTWLQLTRQQRMIGFATCFGLGCLISILSSFMVVNPVKFAFPYTLGNILSIMSTSFLVGPRMQCKYAFAPIRRASFIFFLSMIVCTLVAALVFKKWPLTLLFVIAQFASGLYYSASYIPYGRQILASCAQTCLGQATAAVGAT